MNATVRELARRAGLTRLTNERYATVSEQELARFMELVVSRCAEAAGSVEECRRYRDLIENELRRHFDLPAAQ